MSDVPMPSKGYCCHLLCDSQRCCAYGGGFPEQTGRRQSIPESGPAIGQAVTAVSWNAPGS